MLHATIQVVLYAVLAGLSPLALAATMAVMPAGRLKTLAFGTGFFLAQAFTCSLFVIIGVAATRANDRNHPGIRATLAILLALFLVSLAVQIRRRPRVARKERENPRTQALLERLGRLRFLTTVAAGLLLGIGGPKRLVLTAFAATTITTTAASDGGEAALVVLYVVIATALVWGPVLLFILFGARVGELMATAEAEVERRQPQITFYALLTLAGFLVADALGILLT